MSFMKINENKTYFFFFLVFFLSFLDFSVRREADFIEGWYRGGGNIFTAIQAME